MHVNFRDLEDSALPQMPPIYDISRSYADNLAEGPFFEAALPSRSLPPREEWIDFLGIPLASPIGVAAGPLLSSKWIALAAGLGFDLVTYKTIRTAAHPAHPLPNMVYVRREGAKAVKLDHPQENIGELSVTNSFGMPSMDPGFLMEDLLRAESALQPGQAMIVSVVGTPRPNRSFTSDFVDALLFAKKAGARLIETNFSCPNVDTKAGCLYTSPAQIRSIGSELVKAAEGTPLIIKVGLFTSDALLRETLMAIAAAGFRAVHGINTISLPVVDAHGAPALEGRERAGVCGGQIRADARAFVQKARAVIREEGLELKLLGVGGITRARDFESLLEAGADIAMTAAGMMWDPLLAARYHRRKKTDA